MLLGQSMKVLISARQTIIYQPAPRAVVSQTQILVTAIEGRAASSGALLKQFWAGFCQKDARSAVALALSRTIAAVCSGDGPLIRPQLAARLANLFSYRHISGVPLFCRALVLIYVTCGQCFIGTSNTQPNKHHRGPAEESKQQRHPCGLLAARDKAKTPSAHSLFACAMRKGSSPGLKAFAVHCTRHTDGQPPQHGFTAPDGAHASEDGQSSARRSTDGICHGRANGSAANWRTCC